MIQKTYRLEIKPGRTTAVKALMPDRGPVRSGVIIAHGSGNNMDYPLIARVAEHLADRGRLVVRFNFLYREAGRDVPDSPDVLKACLTEVYEDALDRWELDPARLIIGGKSLGARTSAMVVAEDGLETAGLLYLGFPLHLSGRPDQHRADLLVGVGDRPQMFFAGTRDPLCRLDRLKAVLPGLKGPHRLHVVEGGDHSFRLPADNPRPWEAVQDEIARTAASWLDDLWP